MTPRGRCALRFGARSRSSWRDIGRSSEARAWSNGSGANCCGCSSADWDQTLHGAACHGCLVIAETSCEARNLFLDRALITRLARRCNLVAHAVSRQPTAALALQERAATFLMV